MSLSEALLLLLVPEYLLVQPLQCFHVANCFLILGVDFLHFPGSLQCINPFTHLAPQHWCQKTWDAGDTEVLSKSKQDTAFESLDWPVSRDCGKLISILQFDLLVSSQFDEISNILEKKKTGKMKLSVFWCQKCLKSTVFFPLKICLFHKFLTDLLYATRGAHIPDHNEALDCPSLLTVAPLTRWLVPQRMLSNWGGCHLRILEATLSTFIPLPTTSLDL